MPELPEVETIRKDLSLILPGKTIASVILKKPKMIHPSRAGVVKILNMNKIVKVGRRGKMLFILLKDNNYLLIHLKMTGQLVWRPKKGRLVVGGHPIAGVVDIPNKYTHATLNFTDKSSLYFNDMRQFGYWKVVSASEFENISQTRFGPEPLGPYFTQVDFISRLKTRRRAPIKSVLLDQKVVAGIGNIYADESLWLAKVKPMRQVQTLKVAELTSIHTAIKKILSEAVKYRGTSFDSYVDSFGREGTYWPHRRVYGRQGLACKRCGKIILKTRTAGRGTHYCSKCQK